MASSLIGLAHDHPPRPVAEPVGLRHDQRERHRADDERTDERDDP
jgi:hypothetical protein